MCKTKIQIDLYCNEINKHQHKRKKQVFRTKSYLRLMYDTLKIMGVLFPFIPLSGLSSNNFLCVHRPKKLF